MEKATVKGRANQIRRRTGTGEVKKYFLRKVGSFEAKLKGVNQLETRDIRMNVSENNLLNTF